MNIKRGEIYYIEYQAYGAKELRAGRPAVVVGNPELAEKTGNVAVVYLSTSPDADLPTHIAVRATGRLSYIMCETVANVSLERFGKLSGVCPADVLQQIDLALVKSLGLEHLLTAPVSVSGASDQGNEEYDHILSKCEDLEQKIEDMDEEYERMSKEWGEMRLRMELAEEKARIYHEMYDGLLGLLNKRNGEDGTV